MEKGFRGIDLKDKRFNKLLVIEATKNKNSRAGKYWDCKCDCGEIKSYRSDVLRKTDIQSCGCTLDHVKVGDKFGKLKVIERLGRIKKGRSIFWKCECDCGSGKEVIFSSHTIKDGGYRSCGCLKNPSGKKHPNYTGYKDLSGGLYNRFKKGADVRNIPFRVSKKHLWELFKKNKGKCFLSGIKISFGVNSRIKEKKKETTASLDRIDNTKGYIKGNVHWVHKYINKMKNTHSQENFIKICKLVAKNN